MQLETLAWHRSGTKLAMVVLAALLACTPRAAPAEPTVVAIAPTQDHPAVVAAAAPRIALPTKCAATDKPFRCHQEAVRYHVGFGRAVDLATAKNLYEDACSKRYAASCNNLAVLLTAHPELGAGEPKVLWTQACGLIEPIPCANLRRLPKRPELAVQLLLVDSPLTLDAARWHELAQLACAAGDVFQCEDAASIARIGGLLADECHAGETAECFDAALKATDPQAFAALMGASCTAKYGRACNALAMRKGSEGAIPESLLPLWKGACSDTELGDTDDDVALRNHACSEWAKVVKRSQSSLRAVAKVTASYCSATNLDACVLAKDMYQDNHDAAHAFAIVNAACERPISDSPSAMCLELGERYATGNGTPKSIAKRIELLGSSCVPPSSWATCKEIADHLLSKDRAAASGIFDSFCTPDNHDACYQRALTAETDPRRCTEIIEIAASYEALCKASYKDTCRRQASMCAVAMNELVHPHDSCAHYGSGTGDGSWAWSREEDAVMKLCPKPRWTKRVRTIIEKDDAYHRYLDAAGGAGQID